VNLGIRCHVANDDFFITKCELTERIKQAFDEAGISIPFPQRDMHMFQHILSMPAATPQLPPPDDRPATEGDQVGVDSREHKPQADPE
jgi:small conductance mechanosensitive channel